MKINVLLFDSDISSVAMIQGSDHKCTLPSLDSREDENMFTVGKRVLSEKLNLDCDITLNFLSSESGSQITHKGTRVINETNLYGIIDSKYEGRLFDKAVWVKVPYVINMSTDNIEMLRTYYNILSAYKLLSNHK